MSNDCKDCCFQTFQSVTEYRNTFDVPRCCHPSNMREFEDILIGTYEVFAIHDINLVRRQFEDIQYCPNHGEEERVGLLESLLA